jgi:AraC-like DNA-binding protein
MLQANKTVVEMSQRLTRPQAAVSPVSSPIRLVRASSLKPFINYLEGAGLPAQRWLREAHLSASQLCKDNAPVSLHCSYRFLDLVASSEGMADLGVRVACCTSAFDLGVLGTALQRSLTVGDYLRTGARLIGRLDNSGVTVWLTAEGDRIRVNQLMAGGVGVGPAIADSYTLVLTINMLRRMAGAHWRPTEICLRTGSDRALEDWIAAIDTKVVTGQAHSSFTLRRSDLCRRVLTRGFQRSSQCSVADAPLPPLPDNFLGSIELLVDELITDGPLKLDHVAQAAGISTRMLQRRLAAAGTSFTDILTRVKVSRAAHRLAVSHLSIAGIAAELGYSDASNFSRAFRKVTGVSPVTYRRAQSLLEAGDRRR